MSSSVTELKPEHKSEQSKDLLPFVGGERLNMPNGAPFQLELYQELVDRSSRHLDPRKRGSISENATIL
ncbi:hypothetical protein ACJJIE_09740 [Microbulbifer sp. TRSA001]|uniref:hypothetical protein n=1 Tax=Microbulbifer sp. TRSA001 TaxID=3243381 RepID=UPI00403A39CA